MLAAERLQVSKHDTPAVTGSVQWTGMRERSPGIIIRLAAWMRGGKLVWLRDFQGDVYCSIATLDAFGGASAPVYWFAKVGNCVLLPDGTVCRKSSSSYVREWKWA